MTGFDLYPIPGFHDPVSALTHLIGAAVSAALTPFLLRRAAGHPRRQIYLAVFAFSTVLLLSMSGVYHLLDMGDWRTFFRRLDHGAIFVLIAGTFTPVHGILFRRAGRWLPLVLIWTAAAVGLTLELPYYSDLPESVELIAYIGMGWGGSYSVLRLWRHYGFAFIRPLVWGGVAYTLGGVLEFLRWPTLIPGVVGPHEVFHFGVLAGVGLHWRFVFRIASGEVPRHRSPELRLGTKNDRSTSHDRG